MSDKLRILVVEDNPGDTDFIQAMLPVTGPVSFRVESVSRLSEACTRLEKEAVDLVLLDLGLPDSHGMPTLHKLLKAAPNIPVIVLTGTDDQELAISAVRDGAQDYLVKGHFDGHLLVLAARYALERKRTETTLRESEERLRFHRDNSPMAVVEWNADLIIGRWTGTAEKMFGWSAQEAIGKLITELPGIYEEDMPVVQSVLQRLADGVSKHVFSSNRNYTRNGQVIHCDWYNSVLHDAGGKIISVLSQVLDITERKRAEESQARLAMAVEHAAETIVITDANGMILYANPAFEKTTGYTRVEAIGQNPRILKSGKHDAEFYRRMWAALSAGQVWNGDMTNKRKDGSLYQEDVNIFSVRDAAGRIINYVTVKRDVTEQKKLEAQMLRTQRLESIGTLAGGIAHDLNNALAPIMMSAELLRLEFPDTASRYLELIQASAKRGADMVKQLLTFAKGAEGERLLVQPKHLLKEMEKLITSTFPKNLELRTRYAKDLRNILGDTTQLHQVLLNLCVNARDAMPGGGTLTLEAENMEIDANYARAVPEAKPGPYVVWRVTDTGTGIPPEVLEHIFDPFFTTKGPDKGTGLGLSTTLGIVKGHGGFIRAYSVPGQGSTFAVYLPAYGFGAGDTAWLTNTEMTFHGNRETILVVDDEAAVREMMRAVLTKLNFKVLTAADGTAALIQVSENRTELRVVITDLHMPHMDGLAFVRVLKGRLPQTGIIVVSGRLDEREANEFKKLGVSALIDKPFTQEKLVEALKNLLAPK